MRKCRLSSCWETGACTEISGMHVLIHMCIWAMVNWPVIRSSFIGVASSMSCGRILLWRHSGLTT